MKLFKDILVVNSDAAGDDDALILATNLAEKNEARLTFVDVINDITMPKAKLAERQKRLSRLAASFGDKNIDIETITRVGSPFLEIIQQVLRANHDLVIMAADSIIGFRQLFFGSTSMHLMRKCPCPVWLIKPEQGTKFTRILAAVDTPPEETNVDELNIKIMDMASSIARVNRSELHIVHVWELSGHDLDTIRSETTDKIRKELLQRNELMHRKSLERLLERYSLDDLQLNIHVLRGDPQTLLPKMAFEKDIDLLVMGTVRRTGIAGFLMGNTAESVLRQVECSVLTTKPDGFVTPITLDN
jgi:universal stress protein E